MGRKPLHAAAVLMAGLLCATPAAEAKDGKAYADALTTIAGNGAVAAIFRAWCDARDPENKAEHEAAYEAWWKAARMTEFNTLFEAHFGYANTVPGGLVDKLFAKIDSRNRDPKAFCAELGTAFSNDFSPEKAFPDEFKLVFPES
jgi:hypothetical protein